MSRSDGRGRDDDPGFDPFGEEEDPLLPQRPLTDPLRPDFDPFRIPGDPFQIDDPFEGGPQRPRDTQPPREPQAPRGPEPSRRPPPPPPRGPEPPGHGADEQQLQAPIPSRAARHQAKRRSAWPFSRGPGAPGPADPAAPEETGGRGGRGGRGASGRGGPEGSARGRGLPDRDQRIPRPERGGGDHEPRGGGRPGGAGPGGTTGPFERAPDEGRRPRDGDATGPFDHVPRGRRPGTPGPTTGSFESVRPPRSGSTGELRRISSNGLTDRQTPAARATEPDALSRAGRGASRSRVPHQLPSFPKLEVPSGLARSTLGLVAILILAAAGLGAVASALPSSKPPETPATAAPYSARWICPLLPNQATSVGVSNVGGAAATLRTTVVGGPGASQPAQKPLAAGGVRAVKVPAGAKPGYVQVEAFSSAVAVGNAGRTSCASGPTDRWWIPAADTSLGASTSVVIANPDNDPAVVDLVPHVNQGALVAAAELFVPPRSAVVKTLSNGELIALKPAIEVIAKSGRVVAGAMIAQKDQQKIFVPGEPATHAEWSFAGGLAGPDRNTFVLITNPSSSPLSVSVQVSTDRGTFKPGSEFDNPIPGGASAAIQVPPLRIGGAGAFALRVSSRDGAPFVAALRVTSPTASGTGTYLDLGTGGSDRTWFVPSMPASKQVVLANLGSGSISARLGGAGAGGGGASVKVSAGKVIVRPAPAGANSFQVVADGPGLLVAPLGGGLAVSGAEIGGVPAGGPVVPGQAAA